MSASETRHVIDGPAGPLELKHLHAEGEPRFLAVVCHPHPLHGGTMENKVVYTLSRLLSGLGGEVVRFNFRGVGKSAGEFEQGIGEKQDLQAASEWLRQQFPQIKPFWLAGFSFGAFVSTISAKELNAEQLISIAPAVTRFDFSQHPMPECPWTIVMGDADEIVDPKTVFDWAKTLPDNARLIKMDGAGHFFHGRLVELREKLEAVLPKGD